MGVPGATVCNAPPPQQDEFGAFGGAVSNEGVLEFMSDAAFVGTIEVGTRVRLFGVTRTLHDALLNIRQGSDDVSLYAVHSSSLVGLKCAVSLSCRRNVYCIVGTGMMCVVGRRGEGISVRVS